MDYGRSLGATTGGGAVLAATGVAAWAPVLVGALVIILAAVLAKNIWPVK